MVFEHLEKPRDLFALMVSKLNRDGAIYLSVPFFERRDWPFLWGAGEKVEPLPNLMHDNDVHINHFSIEGLDRMGKASVRGRQNTFYRPIPIGNLQAHFRG